jgi:hypothetical protein
MYLLYLDDSGSVGNRDEEYFVLAGVCVPEHSVRWLSYEVEKIALGIWPADTSLVEFHAAEIYSGRVFPWNRIRDKTQRIQIIQQVLCTLQNAYSDTVTFACAVQSILSKSRPCPQRI